jgi:arylformamidase
MAIHDISLPVSNALVVWPGDPPIHITHPTHYDKGDTAMVSRIAMGAHTGTHVDAPLHFLEDGSSVEALDLNRLIGPALVLHVPNADDLSAAVLENLAIPPHTKRVLFRTRNSDIWQQETTTFFEDFVAVTKDGAQWLVDHGVQVVGVDYLSVASFKDLTTPHRILLRAGVIPVEGLDLSAISPGLYQLICLPLKMAGLEGAPARAILID